MRENIAIIGFGLMIPVGIILAGNANSTGTFWSGTALAIIGFLGSITGIFRRHLEVKSRQSDHDPSDPEKP